jgi:hypothetical protein
MDIQWGGTVPIYLGQRGHVYFVGDVRRAFEILLDRWPSAYRDKDKCRAAHQACLAAIEGTTKQENAREAFREAAEEAGMLVGANA